MPFALIIIGLALLVSAVNGTSSSLFTLIKGDFTGKDNFIFWTVSILVIGSVGYIPKLKPVSDAFLVLVVLVLVLARGASDSLGSSSGLFQKFTQALNVSTTPASGASKISNAATAAGLTLPSANIPGLGTIQ